MQFIYSTMHVFRFFKGFKFSIVKPKSCDLSILTVIFDY